MIPFLIFAGVLLTLLLLTGVTSASLFRLAIVREPQGKNDGAEERFYRRLEKNGQGQAAKTLREAAADARTLSGEAVSIKSDDGLRLAGRFYPALSEPHRTMLLVHGFKSWGLHDFSCVLRWYLENNCNVLLIDQRAHGESEGRYICFGTKERYDLLRWCRFLEQKLGPNHPVVMNGISMGATSVLLAAALPELPGNVRGVIADCGFTSAEEEFRHVMKDDMHLPRIPLLPLANALSRHRAGFGFGDVSTVEQVPAIRVPVLFVHGEADTFVLPENTRRNYEACRAPKHLVTIPGAEHGMSYVVDTPRCQAILREFLLSLEQNGTA